MMGIRGDKIAVPLSFLTFPAAIGAEPEAITPHAPGCTSHLAAAGPLSAGEGPSLFVGWALLFPFLALVTGHYIIISPQLCQVRRTFLSLFFPFFHPVSPRLTMFRPLFLFRSTFFLVSWSYRAGNGRKHGTGRTAPCPETGGSVWSWTAIPTCETPAPAVYYLGTQSTGNCNEN